MASHSGGSERGLRSQEQSQQESTRYEEEEIEEEEEEEEEEDLQLIDEEDDIGGTGSESQYKGESSRSSPKGKGNETEKQRRRKWQNMINQRRYRKSSPSWRLEIVVSAGSFSLSSHDLGQRKREREEAERRESENQDKATSAYVTSDPAELQSPSDLSGIPWGGLNMQYIVGRGRPREERSRPGSREPSTAFESRAGGSSR